MALIIVEGVDFAGKTTLTYQLATKLKALTVNEKRIPQNPKHVQDWVETVRVLSRDRLVICDRTPLISDQIYGEIIRGKPAIDRHTNNELLKMLPKDTIIIWCNPGREYILSCNNEADQMEGVIPNLEKLYEAYKATQLGFFYGGPDESCLHQLSYNFKKEGSFDTLIKQLKILIAEPDLECQDVHSFHKKFGVTTGYQRDPHLLSKEVLEFRYKFMKEELEEFLEAHNEGNLVKCFDALLDLTYVVKGTALMMDILPQEWARGWAAVQKANMSKIRVSSAAESKRGSALDVIKPTGWVGPEEELGRILGSWEEAFLPSEEEL